MVISNSKNQIHAAKNPKGGPANQDLPNMRATVHMA
jgi:hypothetical protein